MQRAAAALAAVLLLATGAAAGSVPFLPNWMGQTMPAIGNLTLLDLSLPGTHDSATWDLSRVIADNANDISPGVAKILHDLVPKAILGTFIRNQAKTQGLNFSATLDGGIRYIDFRVTYSGGPDAMEAYDWYCLHLVETNQKALAYLKQIKSWLDAHPTEVVVLSVTRHGSFCLDDGQYPGTTPQQRQQFWKQIKGVFQGMLFDSQHAQANTTTIAELVKKNMRMVLYAGDYKNFTGGDPHAQDACLIDNDLAGAGATGSAGALSHFKKGAKRRQQDKAQNKLWLMSNAGGGGDEQIKDAALLSFQPFDHDNIRKDCAKAYKIPGVTQYCPMTLQTDAQLAQYYNQRVYEYALKHGYEFPNAIYTNAIDVDGTIRTGCSDFGNPSYDACKGTNLEAKYAYAATMIKSTLNKYCPASQTACQPLHAPVDALRTQYPLLTWNDTAHGRVAGFPVLS